jgi:hypothetical protein
MSAMFSALGILLTAAGVVAAVIQLHWNGQQTRRQFEESLTDRYRQLVAELPVWVFFDDDLAPEQRDVVNDPETLSAFYRYFDLCNEQAFLHRQRRIDAATWEEWLDGIATNVRREAFRYAWEDKLVGRIGSDFGDFRAIYEDVVRSN